jgi:hypothetical protein
MRCHICDRSMSDKEIQVAECDRLYEPCSTCLEIALEAAYSAGFNTEDDEYVLLDEFNEDTDPLTVTFVEYKDTESYNEV